METLKYFAYGSNLNKGQMRRRCPGAAPLAAARLTGHRLTFRGVADVKEAPGHVVWGGLWSITEEDLKALDRYEGYPRLYTRKVVPVLLEDNTTIMAIIYQMVNTNGYQIPNGHYLATIAAGYRDFYLPLETLVEAVQDVKKEIRGAPYHTIGDYLVHI